MALFLGQSAVESDHVFCDVLIASILALVVLEFLWIVIFTVWYISLSLVGGNVWYIQTGHR
jgi:hypothetical protein